MKHNRGLNKIVVKEGVAEILIPATKKHQPRSVLIDANDVELVNDYRWCIAKTGYNSYVTTNVRQANGKYKTLYLHRLIMGKGEILKGRKIPDHINGNTLDNRRENLRLITREVNCSLGRKKVKRSEYRGVTIRYKKVKNSDTRKKIIVATPRIAKGKIMPIYCKTERLAALTYDIASVRYFKKHLLPEQLNFPEYLPEYESVLARAEMMV